MSDQLVSAFNKYVAIIGKPPNTATQLVKFAKINELSGVRYSQASLYLQELNTNTSIKVAHKPFYRSSSSSILPINQLQVRKGSADSISSNSSWSSGGNINSHRKKKRRRSRASYHESDSDENYNKTENVFIPFPKKIKSNQMKSSIVDEMKSSIVDEKEAQGGLPKVIDYENPPMKQLVNGLNIEQIQQRMHSLHSNLSDLQIECVKVCDSIRDDFSYLHDLLFAKEKAMCANVESYANDIKRKINEDLHNFGNEMCDFEENFGEHFQGLNVNVVNVERSEFEGLVSVAFVEPKELIVIYD